MILIKDGIFSSIIFIPICVCKQTNSSVHHQLAVTILASQNYIFTGDSGECVVVMAV